MAVCVCVCATFSSSSFLRPIIYSHLQMLKVRSVFTNRMRPEKFRNYITLRFYNFSSELDKNGPSRKKEDFVLCDSLLIYVYVFQMGPAQPGLPV